MDKLDIWIYIILFILVPVANALFGSKKKKQEAARNPRPAKHTQESDDEDDWWKKLEEWEKGKTEPQREIVKPAAVQNKKEELRASRNEKRITAPMQSHIRPSKLGKTEEKKNEEKDVYTTVGEEPLLRDSDELRKAVITAEILARKF